MTDETRAIAEDALAIAKSERDKREHIELIKRVEAEMPNLPGTHDEKARILKGLESLPEDLHRVMGTILKAGDKAISAAFGPMGAEASGMQDNRARVRRRDDGWDRYHEDLVTMLKYEALGVPRRDAQHLDCVSRETRQRILLDGKHSVPCSDGE